MQKHESFLTYLDQDWQENLDPQKGHDTVVARCPKVHGLLENYQHETDKMVFTPAAIWA
jgi:hypothetical protein